jgi:hypothetical protein
MNYITFDIQEQSIVPDCSVSDYNIDIDLNMV